MPLTEAAVTGCVEDVESPALALGDAWHTPETLSVRVAGPTRCLRRPSRYCKVIEAPQGLDVQWFGLGWLMGSKTAT